MERLSLAKAVSDRNSKQRLQALDGQLKKLKVEQVRPTFTHWQPKHITYIPMYTHIYSTLFQSEFHLCLLKVSGYASLLPP